MFCHADVNKGGTSGGGDDVEPGDQDEGRGGGGADGVTDGPGGREGREGGELARAETLERSYTIPGSLAHDLGNLQP